jgi:SpoVK/Ycf46/Vps4 family AAA+-type ATPase
MTHGYLPCDIYSLVRKAVVYSKADRYMRGNHCHGIQVEIGWSDCLVALGAVGPSQLSHLSATGFAEVVPRQHMNLGASLTWNDFGGSADAKNKIRMLVSRLTENIAFETAEENGASYSKNILSDSLRDKPKGMVLTGPSGHGKSYLARIIAAEV